MKIDAIEGSASDKNHPQWIELDSLEFKSMRSVRTRSGVTGNREAGLPHIAEIELAKQLDKSSIGLFQQFLKGQALPQVTIDICQTGKEGATPYNQYILSEVLVTGFHESSISAGSDLPLEIITLNFTKLEKRFIPYDKSGKATSPINASYDLETMQVS